MIRTLIASAALVVCSGPALAEAAAPAGGGPAAPAGKMMMDMSKMGPWARKPTNEKKTKAEIADFVKHCEALEMKGDHDGMLADIDFPVYMVTDDSKGVPTADPWDKEKYVATMKPFWDNAPKDKKMSHKLTTSVLSDSLANVIDDYTMTMNGKKMSGRSMTLVVKRDGQWKWKIMAEAGWGDVPPANPTANADAAKGSGATAAAAH